MSTRTVRSIHVQLPAASDAPSRSACAPSAHARVSSAAPIVAPEHGTGRLKSHGRTSSCTGRPSSSTRPVRTPLLSPASKATSATPRSQPSPAPSAPRAPPTAGADPSARYTRTWRIAISACRASRRQRVASQRTSAWIRCVESPRSSWCTHCSTDVLQCTPHHSQAPRVASSTPTLHPGLASSFASKSTPVIVVPAGASKESAAVVPAGACPGPGDVAHDHALSGAGPREVDDAARAGGVRGRARCRLPFRPGRVLGAEAGGDGVLARERGGRRTEGGGRGEQQAGGDVEWGAHAAHSRARSEFAPVDS